MFRDTKRITDLVLHCAATRNGKHVTVYEIDEWHLARGFRRSARAVERDPRHLRAIGYHRVIYVSGDVVQGRDFDEVGAHAPRADDVDGLEPEAALYPGNSRSIGVCLIGTDAFTLPQWEALSDEVARLMAAYSIERIWSHHQINPGKTCPGFSARGWLAGGMQPGETIVV